MARFSEVESTAVRGFGYAAGAVIAMYILGKILHAVDPYERKLFPAGGFV